LVDYSYSNIAPSWEHREHVNIVNIVGGESACDINGQALDEPLEPEGIEQVKEAISTIPREISKIYSSDMLRTRQTSEILNQELGLNVSFHPELREIEFGELSGKSWSEIKELYGENLWQSYIDQVYDFTPYKGESFLVARERVSKLLEEIKSNHSDNEAVLIVAHGGIMRLLSHLYTNEHYESTKNASIRQFDI